MAEIVSNTTLHFMAEIVSNTTLHFMAEIVSNTTLHFTAEIVSNTTLHFRVKNGPLLVSNMSQMNPAHTCTTVLPHKPVS
jgi:hypothetical protein